MKKSTKGYTQEQMEEAVKLYQDRPDLTLVEIASRLNISDAATVSHWAKDAGLPLRRPKSAGWKKVATSSSRKTEKMITCPSCGKRYKPRDGQKFCHLCGADITPLDEKCKIHLTDIYTYLNNSCVNPHILSHPELVAAMTGLIEKLKDAQSDLNKYFNS